MPISNSVPYVAGPNPRLVQPDTYEFAYKRIRLWTPVQLEPASSVTRRRSLTVANVDSIGFAVRR